MWLGFAMNGTPEIGPNLMPRFDNWADSANQNAILSNFMLTKVGSVFLMTTVSILDEMTMGKMHPTLRT